MTNEFISINTNDCLHLFQLKKVAIKLKKKIAEQTITINTLEEEKKKSQGDKKDELSAKEREALKSANKNIQVSFSCF